jgi:hypothetical protein
MLGIAIVAVIAAVLSIALSAGRSHPRQRAAGGAPGGQSAAQAAASYLGLGLAQVRRRLRNGETLEQIADSTPGHSARALERAIVAGRSAELQKHGATPAQTAAALHKLRARLRAQLRRKRRARDLVAGASRYLGIDEAAVRRELRSGRTLAQVAEAHGHSREQLVEGIVRGRVGALETARAQGQITRAEEKRAIALLRTRVARAVQAKNL